MKKIGIMFIMVAMLFATTMCTPAQGQTPVKEKKVTLTDTWARLDADALGVYAWVGGNLNLGNLCIAHDAVFNFPTQGSIFFEAGPYISTLDGKFDMWPALGAAVDFMDGQTNYFVPELYLFSTFDKIYFEVWNQYYMGTGLTTSAENFYYGRYIAKASIGDFQIGPYAEITYDFDLNETLLMPVGVVVAYPYFNNGSFDLALCKDLKTDMFSPRLTYIHRF